MLVSKLWGSQPSLKITLLEELLFLHPGPVGEPTEDPWVAGTVTLTLPKASSIRGLSVRIVGKQDLYWPRDRPMESSVSLDKEVKLFHEGDMLEKGEHTWEFQILVPSSTAPYERSFYGRVRHFVTATAKGLGKLGGDLVESKVLYLIPNPGGPGQSRPPPSLHLLIEGVTDHVGPYLLNLKSPFIMVGGCLFMRFNIIDPPTDLVVWFYKVRFDQQFTLKSTIDLDYVVEPPASPVVVMEFNNSNPPNDGDMLNTPLKKAKLNSAPLAVVPKGTSHSFVHLGRIPLDDRLRPSTIEGVQASISIRHNLTIQMVYEADGEKREFTLSKPVDVFSCCCLIASLSLPLYSKDDPNPEAPNLVQPPCVCTYKDAFVAERHQKRFLLEDRNLGVIPTPKPILTHSQTF